MLGKKIFERPALRGRRPALTQDVAADLLQAALEREGVMVPAEGELGVAL
jgi:hypothetical protein